jgi:hypothetical protein
MTDLLAGGEHRVLPFCYKRLTSGFAGSISVAAARYVHDLTSHQLIRDASWTSRVHSKNRDVIAKACFTAQKEASCPTPQCNQSQWAFRNANVGYGIILISRK